MAYGIRKGNKLNFLAMLLNHELYREERECDFSSPASTCKKVEEAIKDLDFDWYYFLKTDVTTPDSSEKR